MVSSRRADGLRSAGDEAAKEARPSWIDPLRLDDRDVRPPAAPSAPRGGDGLGEGALYPDGTLTPVGRGMLLCGAGRVRTLLFRLASCCALGMLIAMVSMFCKDIAVSEWALASGWGAGALSGCSTCSVLRGVGGSGYSSRCWRLAPDNVRLVKASRLGLEGNDTELCGWIGGTGGTDIGSGMGDMGDVSRAVCGRLCELAYAESGRRAKVPQESRRRGVGLSVGVLCNDVPSELTGLAGLDLSAV